METKTTARADLQRTPSFEEGEGESPERESPIDSRDGQSSQSAETVPQTAQSAVGECGGDMTDTPQKMALKRTTKTDLQRIPSFEMGSAMWQSHSLARGGQHTPPSSVDTDMPRLRTSHSCTSLEQVSQMSSDGHSSVSATSLVGGRKSDSARVTPSDVQLSSQQLEERFRDLALRFKANKVKLEERAKQHKHNRDITEENINRELTDLHKLLKSVTSSDTEVHVLCTRLRQHVSVLEQTSRQLASRCEEHGAVKQELRESSEVDMMIQYVENLKREYENLKHTSSIATPQSAGARQRARGQNALPRRATVQTISPSSYQPAKLSTRNSLSQLQEEKLSVTGKALRRAVSCFPSMSTKHLATEVAKEQDALARLKVGDNDDTSTTGAADDGDAVQRLESVEELELLEAPASNGSVTNGRTSPDGANNRRRTLVRRKMVRQFSDHNDTPTVTEEPDSLFDDCVTSTQDTERWSCAQRVTSWLAPWRWGGTLLQKLRYVFSCLIFVCGIITFVFIFVPTRKALKMDSNAQTVEVDDILKPYTSLRHHAAPPV